MTGAIYVDSAPVNMKVALAVSGGSDSLAMMYMLGDLFALKPCILTVDHDLRQESLQECLYVQRQARALGFKCEILKWVRKTSENVMQSDARYVRYCMISDWCKLHDIECICTAHHIDDIVETMAINVARGSGVDGLIGLGEEVQGLKLLRPMMQYTKMQLREYLSDMGVLWKEDPSNSNDKYTRTFYRKLFDDKKGGLIRDRLLLLRNHIKSAKQSIDFYVQKFEEGCVQVCRIYGYAKIKYLDILSYPEETVMRVILKVIAKLTNCIYKPRFRGMKELMMRIKNKGSCTMCGCIVRWYRGEILLMREYAAIKNSAVHLRRGMYCIWDNRFLIESKSNELTCKALDNPCIQDHLLKNDNVCRDVLRSLPAARKSNRLVFAPCIASRNGRGIVNMYCVI